MYFFSYYFSKIIFLFKSSHSYLVNGVLQVGLGEILSIVARILKLNAISSPKVNLQEAVFETAYEIVSK